MVTLIEATLFMFCRSSIKMQGYWFIGQKHSIKI